MHSNALVATERFIVKPNGRSDGWTVFRNILHPPPLQRLTEGVTHECVSSTLL